MSEQAQDQRARTPDVPFRASLTAVLDALDAGIIVYDAAGTIVYVNASAPVILGLSPEGLLNQRIEYVVAAVTSAGATLAGTDLPGSVVRRTGQPVEQVVGVDLPERGRRWLHVDAHPLAFDDGTIGVLSALTDVTDERKASQSTEMFVALSNAMVRVAHETALMQTMCDVIVTEGGFALAWIGFADPGPDESIRIAYSAGATTYLFPGIVSWSDTRPQGRGPAGRALRTGEIQITNDIAHDPDFELWRDRSLSFGLRSSISLLFHIGAQRAVLAVYAHERFAFDAITVTRLSEIAHEFGLGVAHLRTLEQVSAALDGTLAALSHLAESRDPYTAGHQSRVGSLGGAMARYLGLDHVATDLIHKAGQVHDIGKTSIPAEILTRPGRLSAIEFDMIKQHAQIGGDILSRAALPWPIADVALQHHERLDGSGYPHGLSGDEIILPARIIAVADVVEAMSQHRPYRPALGLEAALAEVTAGAGRLFDPDVVAACHAVFAMGYTFEWGTWTTDS
jgi:PAS domain S-box-containing protein